MKRKLLHTPEGVRDIYNEECKRKLTIQHHLHHVLKLYGYNDIQTPTFEFFDIFNQETGTAKSKEMFKFFDREGNTLVLRPDITPSVARAAAKYYMEEQVPLRFSYMGNTFINNSSYQGRLKENTQLGVELMGEDSGDADAEVVALAIECLLKSGLDEFQVEIGHVDFFNSLIEEAAIDEETEIELRDYIENKNFFAVETLLADKDINSEIRDIFLKIPEMFGSIEKLVEVKELTKNKRALYAIERLEKVYKTLGYYGLQKYVSFDLGMLNKYDYYTGIIFKGYTYGLGEAVVQGGRYDNLLKKFGKDLPSVGFAIVIDNIMSALSRQKIAVDTEHTDMLMVYGHDIKEVAIKFAGELRSKNVKVEMMKKYVENSNEYYKEYAKKNDIAKVFFINTESDLCEITKITKEEA